MAETKRMQTRLAPSDASRVELWADENDLSESEAVRRLVRAGLRQKDSQVAIRTVVMFAPLRSLTAAALFILDLAVTAVGMFFVGAGILTWMDGGNWALLAGIGVGVMVAGGILGVLAAYIGSTAAARARRELLKDEQVTPDPAATPDSPVGRIR